jgi:hypothetical protein
MRQIADRNGCDLGEVVGAEYLDLVEPADRYICKSASRSFSKNIRYIPAYPTIN